MKRNKSQPTISSVLGHFQQSITTRLMESMKIGGGQFTDYEVLIIYPAINLYLHYMGGVDMALNNNNFIVALSSARGMIESLAALTYDGTARLTQDEYKKFYKKGRFYRKNSENKWEEVSQRNLIKHMKLHTGFDALKMYDFCCSYLHFSTKHSGFMVQQVSGNMQMNIQIGSSSKIPAHLQKEILQFCSDASVCMMRCLAGHIEERKKRFSQSV